MNLKTIDNLPDIRFWDKGFPGPSDFEDLYGYSQLAILADDNTLRDCLPCLLPALGKRYAHILTIPSGEQFKSLEQARILWKKLTDTGLDRDSLLICLGGGVVTDIGGFVASTYMRGIDSLLIPTSLLGMVDAAIGGKTGVNFENRKNYIGTFSHPVAIWIVPAFLETLPTEEFLHGKAEILKHGLIADSALFDRADQWLPDNSPEGLLDLIVRSVEIKVRIVSDDPRELGSRRLLNFGHTIGHALESLYGSKGKVLPHGSAVAAGILMESFLSMEAFGHHEEWLDRILTAMRKHFAPVLFTETEIPTIKEFLGFDKKKDDEGVGFTLLRQIGHGIIQQRVEDAALERSFRFYLEKICANT